MFSKRTDVDYARYMDDMDFGVDTEAEAKVILRDLDLALHTRNIRLNSGKTKILTALDAARYFRIAENSRLTVLIEKIRDKVYLEKRERVFIMLVSKLIDRGITDKAFDDGNGGKVLKRLLGLAARLGAPLGDHSLRMILYSMPALREGALKASIRSHCFPRQIDIITGFLGSGQAVDDYSRVLIATTLASAIYPVALPYLSLFELLYQLREVDPFVLYSRLWLILRFDTRSRLWDEIKKTQGVWSRHNFLCRLVAGFSGILRQSAYFSEFENVVKRWGGPEGLSVFDLHESVATTIAGYEAIRPFIEAGNPSIPTNLSHPKSLLLASALCNKNIKKAGRSKLLGLHSVAMNDTYYRQTFSYIISNAA